MDKHPPALVLDETASVNPVGVSARHYLDGTLPMTPSEIDRWGNQPTAADDFPDGCYIHVKLALHVSVFLD